jgi:hypothetical protein
LPEPKDRKFHELNILFEHRLSARKFKKTQVDVFRGESIAVDRMSDKTLADDAVRNVVEKQEVK